MEHAAADHRHRTAYYVDALTLQMTFIIRTIIEIRFHRMVGGGTTTKSLLLGVSISAPEIGTRTQIYIETIKEKAFSKVIKNDYYRPSVCRSPRSTLFLSCR